MQPLSSRPIVLIAFAQIIMWASTIYLFPAMLLTWENALGWSRPDVVFGLTLAVLVSGISAPLIGRVVDKGYGRILLISSALLTGLLLLTLPHLQRLLHFYLIWGAMGLTLAGCLYEACFAYLTAFRGAQAKGAIALITLISGIASTIAFPLVAELSSSYGWEMAIRIFAFAVLGLAVPLFWLATKLIEAEGIYETVELENASIQDNSGTVKAIVAKPAFWIVAIGFAFIALNHGMILNHFLPLLVERDVEANIAILVISMFGPLQITGRLAVMVAEKKISSPLIVAIAFMGITLASIILYLAGSTITYLVFFVILQGGCYGVMSILRPVVIGDVLGRKNFGVISGLAAMMYLIAVAFSPSIGAWLWETSGYDLMLLVAAILTGIGSFSFLWLNAKFGQNKSPSKKR